MCMCVVYVHMHNSMHMYHHAHIHTHIHTEEVGDVACCVVSDDGQRVLVTGTIMEAHPRQHMWHYQIATTTTTTEKPTTTAQHVMHKGVVICPTPHNTPTKATTMSQQTTTTHLPTTHPSAPNQHHITMQCTARGACSASVTRVVWVPTNAWGCGWVQAVSCGRGNIRLWRIRGDELRHSAVRFV